MTIFAVICAAPSRHPRRTRLVRVVPLPPSPTATSSAELPLAPAVGRPAVSTYFTVSLLFWYMGLILDLATMRDRAIKNIHRTAKLGPSPSPPDASPPTPTASSRWAGSSPTAGGGTTRRPTSSSPASRRPWSSRSTSIVSFDFAVSVIPGWHRPIFPPYFVAGAIFSGFAMVLTLMIPMRELYPGMKNLLTLRHIENMVQDHHADGTPRRLRLRDGVLHRLVRRQPVRTRGLHHRATGPYWWAYWTMVTCNVISPQLFWFKWCRTTPGSSSS